MLLTRMRVAVAGILRFGNLLFLILNKFYLAK